MGNTLKLGNGKWATKINSILAYSDENERFAPIPMKFSRGSIARTINQQGNIEVINTSVPRISFDKNPKGAYFIEDERTNKALFSKKLDESVWVKDGATVAPYPSLAPDGRPDANVIIFGANPTSSVSQLVTTSAGTDVVRSIWLRGSLGGEVVKLSNPVTNEGTSFTLTSKWVRYDHTDFSNGASGIKIEGTAWNTVYAWGGQLEEVPFHDINPSSLIQTEGYAITRDADKLSVKDFGNSYIIKQIGAFYIDWTWTNVDSSVGATGQKYVIAVTGDNPSDYFAITYNEGNQLGFFYVVGGFVKVYYQTRAYNVGDRLKIAFSYKTGDSTITINGAVVNRAIDIIPPVLNKIELGYTDSSYLNSPVVTPMQLNDFRVFNNFLTIDESRALTQ